MNPVVTAVGFVVLVLCVLGVTYLCVYPGNRARQTEGVDSEGPTIVESTFELPSRYPTILTKPLIPQGVVPRLVRYHQQNVLVAYLPADVVARIGEGSEAGVVQLDSQAAIRAVVGASEQAAFETQAHYPRYFIAAQPA